MSVYIGTSELKNAYIGEYVEPREPGANTIGYWELNGNGNDTKNDYGVQTYTATDYDSDGYVGAGNPTYTTGRNGKQCAYFDGTRGLKLPSLPIPSNTLTFSLWVKLNNNPTTPYRNVFQLREDIANSNKGWAFMFSLNNGRLFPQWVGTTTSSGETNMVGYSTNGITFATNTWYNVVATFNAGTLKFYVNGSLVDTGSGNPWLRNIVAGSPSYIGCQYMSLYPESAYTNGYVQDVIYENRTWSNQDVADYYANY